MYYIVVYPTYLDICETFRLHAYVHWLGINSVQPLMYSANV